MLVETGRWPHSALLGSVRTGPGCSLWPWPAQLAWSPSHLQDSLEGRRPYQAASRGPQPQNNRSHSQALASKAPHLWWAGPWTSVRLYRGSTSGPLCTPGPHSPPFERRETQSPSHSSEGCWPEVPGTLHAPVLLQMSPEQVGCEVSSISLGGCKPTEPPGVGGGASTYHLKACTSVAFPVFATTCIYLQSICVIPKGTPCPSSSPPIPQATTNLFSVGCVPSPPLRNEEDPSLLERQSR